MGTQNGHLTKFPQLNMAKKEKLGSLPSVSLKNLFMRLLLLAFRACNNIFNYLQEQKRNKQKTRRRCLINDAKIFS